MTTRRRFLQCAGTSAAVAWAAGHSAFAQEPTAKSVEAKSGNRPALPFELGIATYTFRKFPLDTTLTMTKRVDIKHLCLKDCHLPVDAKPEVITDALAKAKAAGIDIYGCGVVYMKSADDVKKAFDFAKAAGMKVIVGVPVAELLPLVNEKVQEYDIRVAIHNHGPNDKNYPKAADAYEKIKGMDRRLGLCLDIGHTVRIGDSLNSVAEQFADRLFDVHIKDETAATPQGNPLEIGHGVIDIPGFLRTLVKVGFSGKVSFEYEKDGDDPLPGLAESIGYVRGVLATI
jgi:sugar phosphate isomerase/epimerase